MIHNKNNFNQITLMNTEQLHELIREIQNLKEIILRKNSDNEIPALLRTKEVCEILKISVSTAADLRQNGTIPFTKIGGSIYHFKKDIIRIMKENYLGWREV